MKNISRENYEVWFIDYLDGKLGESSKQELNAFLEANPDLAEELKSFESLELKPEPVAFSPKSQLEKSEAGLMEISDSEYLLVKQMEEGLNDDEEQELAQILKNDESLIKRGKQFQLTRLASEAINYPGKASLIHRGIGTLYTIGIRVASAAAMIFAAVWGYQNFLLPDTKNSVAGLTPLESRSIPAEEPVIDATHLDLVSIREIEETNQPEEAKVHENQLSLPEEKRDIINDFSSGSEPEMTLLASAGTGTFSLPVEIPSAYETGLRHMMPQYLDIHNRQQALMTTVEQKSANKNENSLFVKGLKFVDKVSGDLVNFERLYDEDGNYVAYNLKAGNIEMKQKVKTNQ